MYILGIDYGRINIGLAIADEELKIAMPYKNIKNKDTLSYLKKIIKELDVKRIVIGMPMGLDNQKTNFTEPTKHFIEKLKKNLSLPISEFDERFTTQMAKKLINSSDNHKVAAQIILQNYIDSN
ncbi:MAG TPA: Holliday junction resolvase RuvX [Patescibacteria group bacterium]|nr:Holliday junction resolvase RuvX [Patescibacteria group bacterium]